MIRDEFKPGSKIGIEISTGDSPGLYVAKVQVAREDIIGTSVPVFSGRMARFTKGDKVSLVPFAADEADRLPSTIVDFFPTPISLYMFKNPDCEFGADKRDWPRIEARIPMEYFSLQEGKRSFLPGIAANISGGGLLLETSEQMQAGERLIIKLGLDTHGEISATCQVVRCMAKEGTNGEIHNFCGLNFVDINDEDRKKILAHIAKQLKQSTNQ